MNISPRIHVLLLVGYCIVILFLSIININWAGELNQSKISGLRADHLAHVFLFFPWMPLYCWGRRGKTNRRIFLAAVFTGVALAAVSESAQLFVPSRAFNIVDLLANGLGVAIGTLTVAVVWRMGKKVVSCQ